MTTAFVKKWQGIDVIVQLANIGSEVARLIHWRKRKDLIQCSRAFQRVLDLLDLSINLSAQTQKVREFLRLREVLCDYFLETKNYRVSPQILEAYFLPFALLARNKYDSK